MILRIIIYNITCAAKQGVLQPLPKETQLPVLVAPQTERGRREEGGMTGGELCMCVWGGLKCPAAGSASAPCCSATVCPNHDPLNTLLCSAPLNVECVLNL